MTRLAGLALAALLAATTVAAAACPLPAGGAKAVETVLTRTNTLRVTRGRTRVRLSPALAQAAQAQACFMAQTRNMSHAGAGGSTVGDRASAAGYRWTFIAENVAAGHPDARSVFKGWRRSRGHRENMLARPARDIGIGVAEVDGRLYWAMVLGAPS